MLWFTECLYVVFAVVHRESLVFAVVHREYVVFAVVHREYVVFVVVHRKSVVFAVVHRVSVCGLCCTGNDRNLSEGFDTQPHARAH